MKQGKNCDISGGQCKSGLASRAKGRQVTKICDISGGGVVGLGVGRTCRVGRR